MDFDDIALVQFDRLRKEWVERCSRSASGICELANRYRNRDDCLLRSMHSGLFNFSLRLHWEDDGDDWLIRFPLPGKSMFPEEKVRGEAILMTYIADNTTVPVPRVIASGTADENPTGLGPFIIMTWVEGRKMSEVLRTSDSSDKKETLNPDIDEEMLKALYGQMAQVLLELWKLDFDCIGSLGNHEVTGKAQVTKRPLTLAMNELVRTCGLTDLDPPRTYNSSTDYIVSLLQLQSKHLKQQRNSIYDSTDCREKYACRQLMKASALNFLSPEDNYGPFKLFCDGLCPGNVLVNDSLQITGIIDWGFCYAAPAQFAGSIPWWLLLERPHRIIYNSGAKASAWFNMACRMVPSVDMIYWDLLDEYCWGPRKSIAERVYNATTTPEMHKAREDFVKAKVKQLQQYYAELGDETVVSYEVEQTSETEDSIQEYKVSGNGILCFIPFLIT
ncbi:aminoglycoside phosphotransferase family protein [Aspergillus vadensis CBS 113365]|uniref:Phosphotransferase enzyme family protein n=1 Tax=Aspergillus vadensis (strain CBS 113365 / IMI 142717 / IBT 24658) TaxID=1448311 RepID=A0A319BFC2_ASPVC|nr:phosphotransferase enzyme family protein [Aspergillus vadensis CBS 113365]PYH70851.1 phosphotransferase enzyme family protein [Aspergillus vadensis CBS 113365]